MRKIEEVTERKEVKEAKKVIKVKKRYFIHIGTFS